MKFWALGIVLLLAGIPLMDVNFYLGMVSMGIGAGLAACFGFEAMRMAASWGPACFRVRASN